MICKGYEKTYDFRKFKTTRVFDDNIKTNFVSMNMASDEQNHLTKYIKEFKSKIRPQRSNLKRVKEDPLSSAKTLIMGREMVLKASESRIFLKPEQKEQSSSDDK